MTLTFNVENQIISRTDGNRVVADSLNYLYAEFTFSQEWTGTASVNFKKGTKVYTVILDGENKCLVPSEVLTEGRFSVSCFCGDRITANKAYVIVIASGYEHSLPDVPTPDVYSQIIARLDEAVSSANAVMSAYESGELNGERGELNYSTQEQEVGTWIDGKTLYQRSYSLTLPSSTSDSKITDIDASGFDNVVSIDALIDSDDGEVYNEHSYFPVSNSYYRTNSERFQCYFYKTPETTLNAIRCFCGSTFTSCPAVITLRYTKA